MLSRFLLRPFQDPSPTRVRGQFLRWCARQKGRAAWYIDWLPLLLSPKAFIEDDLICSTDGDTNNVHILFGRKTAEMETGGRCCDNMSFQIGRFVVRVYFFIEYVEGWAKECALGCVNSPSTARGCPEAESRTLAFTSFCIYIAPSSLIRDTTKRNVSSLCAEPH